VIIATFLTPFSFTIIAFCCIFGGALLGLFLQRFLPEHHLKPESKDAVKLGAGLIATMAALVIGILVGSAKSSFDNVTNNITQGGAKFIYLDRVLANYGPETADVRQDIRSSVQKMLIFLWPKEYSFPGVAAFDPKDISGGLETIAAKIRRLPQNTPDQTVLRSEAIQATSDLMQYRWLIFTQSQNTLPRPLFGLLLLWVTTLNFIYALFAPRNGTVVMALFCCALAVAGAILLIVEMNRPLEGLVRVPSKSFSETLQFLGK